MERVGKGALTLPPFDVSPFDALPECLMRLKRSDRAVKYLNKIEP